MRLACLASALLAACTASAEEVRPPANELFFPTGAAIAPDESFLFVANANSELRYDSGSISVLDTTRIDQVVADWVTSGVIPGEADCAQDIDFTETLVCDESSFISDQAGVRIGNFATDVAVQDRDNGALRLIIPTRGDPSIAWVDWTGSELTCNASGGSYALCDDAHRLSFISTAPDLAVPEEPFGVFADSAGQFAMVTHLTTGAITLIDSPKDGPALVTDVASGVFLPDQNTGLRGATGVAGRTPQSPEDIVYVGSRSDNRIQTFTVGRPPNGAGPYMLQGEFFFLDAAGGNSGESRDTRGMAFSPTGDRLYLVNRRPPTLQIYDTSTGATGHPLNIPTAVVDMCRQASTVAVADAGDGERAYVTCFQDGQIYIVDPRGSAQTEDILLVGRGPYSVVAAPNFRKKLYVTNFLEDTISVIDIDPNSSRRHRVVLRIGKPRAL